ncbi:GDSL-type esterase/lipase family protein [Hansschlegelia sp. KR7-227]|uniref:SGNH/GDSL hydrolase family protein n=1 Tax=Hansschlegelia sp. KR7-227 TaxID=3400914 RepID=UPI003C0F04E6
MTRAILCALLALTALSLLGVVPDARAQDAYPRYFEGSPRGERVYRQRRYEDDDDAYFERRLRSYRRDAIARRDAERRRRVQEADRSQRQGFSVPFLQRLFGGAPSEPTREPSVEVRPPPRIVRRRPPDRPRPPSMAAPAAPAPGVVSPGSASLAASGTAQPVPATTFIAVFGDSVADGLAGGLEEGFADTPDVGVRRHVKANAGLVRADYFDFVEEAKKAVAAGPLQYAVIDVGVNDRQPFLDMRQAAPLSPEWTERYKARIDALLQPFMEKKIPVYWVGLAPSESVKASSDHTALNALIKERVEAAGGTYVDVWEGFVDEEGAYVASGPQLDGQTGRLRLDDGVHFSKAGSRKLAHYAEREIRKVLQPKPATVEAIPGAVAPDADAQATAPSPMEAFRQRPVASPLVVLTAPRRASGGALAAAAPIPAATVSPDAERVLLRGEAPDAAPGRLDDARWPGAEPASPDKPAAGSPAPSEPAAKAAP